MILPKPELYVVYSGNRSVPDEISFKDDFFEGDSPVDLRITILSRTDETIYGQYIGFCKVYDEQRKLYDNSIKCIEETIKICLEKGYLMTFLNLYKRVVVTMMSELFDEQVQREQYDIAVLQQNNGDMVDDHRHKCEALQSAAAQNLIFFRDQPAHFAFLFHGFCPSPVRRCHFSTGVFRIQELFPSSYKTTRYCLLSPAVLYFLYSNEPISAYIPLRAMNDTGGFFS